MKRSTRPNTAFSILELLVVISIMTIVILIAVPSFQSLTYSMRRSSAENSLKGGLRAARMVAIEAGDGVDAAAVFIHEPGGRITIIPCIYVGELLDQRPGSRSPLVRAQIFAPVAGVDAIQLPKGWSVRAYAPPNSITTGRSGWYNSGNYPASRGNWVFPETGFFDPRQSDDGDNRQTFMVRYRGGSGEVDLSSVEPVLVLDPVASDIFRSGTFFKQFRADLAIDKVRFVRSVLDDDVTFSGPSGLRNRADLLGNRSTDTVLARAVGQIAVFSESRLAGGVGARRLNRDTETLYMGTVRPELDLSLFGSGASEQSISEDVSDWLESRLASSDAMVFTIQRYSGRAQEMVPLEPNTRGTR
jgi:type II secretory pathway pseudopilin PulG